MLLSTVIYVLYITLSLPTLYFTVYYVCFIVRQSFFFEKQTFLLPTWPCHTTHDLWTFSLKHAIDLFFLNTFSDFSGLSRWSAYSHCLVTALKSTHSITCNFLFRVFFLLVQFCVCWFYFICFCSIEKLHTENNFFQRAKGSKTKWKVSFAGKLDRTGATPREALQLSSITLPAMTKLELSDYVNWCGTFFSLFLSKSIFENCNFEKSERENLIYKHNTACLLEMLY